MKNYLLLLAVAATVGFASCSKDDDEVKAKTKTDLLTAKSWKVSAIGVDTTNDGKSDEDITSFFPTCSKDNIFTFKTDKTFIIDEGATKCDASDPQTNDSGTWAFSSDEKNLLITSTGSTSPTTVSLLELNENTARYGETVSDSTGSFTIITTLVH